MEEKQHWGILDPALMEPDGDIPTLMPAWMQKAKDSGVFDAVQTVEETDEWKVSAGTPVGFMGCEEYPGRARDQAEREWFVHLEVLSTDPKMPAFLGNPEGVKGEKRTVLAPKGKILYTRSALYFWDYNNLYSRADNGISREVSDSITRIVNLYDNHYADRYNNLVRFIQDGVFDEIL